VGGGIEPLKALSSFYGGGCGVKRQGLSKVYD